MADFRVVEFSEQALFESLANSHSSADEVAEHKSTAYLHSYLQQIGAMTIVIEDPYVDGDYLDDFASYYVKCHTEYQRWCKRIHFFGDQLTKTDLLHAIRGGDSTKLQNSYLGFVVARPLPETIIGRTLLRTYDADNGRRVFPAVRKYPVNLFGIALEIISLPFQEQDNVLAACATVALWSSFQKTAELFHTPTPTPAMITRSASEVVHFGRPIPSHGLKIEEICSAIRSLELEPELFDLSAETVPLVSLLYAYLAAGLAPILVVEIEEAPQILGRHAITLAGYSLRNVALRSKEIPGEAFIPMKGLRIDKFYGHDDQIGPFARHTIARSKNKQRYPIRFKTSWAHDQTHQELPVYPFAVIVPVYHKVRLTFIDVYQWLDRLHEVIRDLFPAGSNPEWDVRLQFSNEYKIEVRRDDRLAFTVKESLLKADHPRFWWRAALTLDEPVLELLFDATGFARSFPLNCVIWRDEGFASVVEQALSDPAYRADLEGALGRRYLSFLTESVKKRKSPIVR